MLVLLRWRNVSMVPLVLAVMAMAIAPAYVSADPKPDVFPTSLSLGTGSITIGGSAPLRVTVTNRGRGTAYDVAVTLSIATGGTASRVSQISVGNLKPGASTTVVTTLTAPAQPGNYDVIATSTVRRDGNQTNNSTAVGLQVTSSSTVASTTTTSTTSTTPTSSDSASSGSTTTSTGGTTTSTGGTTTSTGGTTTSTGGTTTSTGGTTSSTGGTTSSTGGTTSSTGDTTSSTGSTTPSSQPTPTYIEKLGFQVVATDGSCASPTYLTWPGPEASADKIFIAYMYDPDGCGSSGANHNIKIGVYDYVTGTWTLRPGLLGSSFYTYCCDGHDTPSIYRNPVTGLLDVVYGGISSGGSCGPSDSQGPYFNTSSNAAGSSWSSRQRIPALFTSQETTGGYDSNGTLHLQGSLACGPGGTRASERNYYRRSPNGTWTTTQGLIRIGDNGSQLHRGEPHPAYLSVIGNTLHLVWQRMVDNYMNTRDLFYAKSTDGGTTWCSANGSACFSTSSPLLGTWDAASGLYDYPASYRVAQYSGYGMVSVGALADGTPVAAAATSRGTMFYRFVSGNTWSATVIDSSGTEISRIVTTRSGKILMYGGDYFTMKEYASTNGGTTFTSTVLRTKGAEVSNRWPQPRIFASLGGKERVIVQWVQPTGSFHNVVVMDRPQE